MSDNMVYRGQLTPREHAIPYDEIEGSPYHNEDLMSGTVILTVGDTLLSYLRYNSFTDEMEFVRNNKILAMSHPQDVDVVYLNDMVYRSCKYLDFNKQRHGFFIELVSGSVRLLKHERVNYKEAEKAKTSYHQPVPAKFVETSPRYFYSVNGAIARELNTSGNSLDNIFREESDLINRYMKENRLKLRREEDMIQVFEYINTVNNK